MLRGLDRFDARSVEDAGRRFWSARGLPPSTGVVGPATGAHLHQLFGPLARAESPWDLLQRAIVADADARYLAQAGRRTSGALILRRQPGVDDIVAVAGDLVRRIGLWVAGGQLETVGAATSTERLQAMVDRLAGQNVLVSREAPFRSCPRCRLPRTPAGIVYEEADGPAFLVRFPLAESSPRVSLLVWVDSLWKLLGTTGLLVHPDQRYVTVRYRRHGSEELLVLAQSAVDRLQGWLPGAEVEIVGEGPGATFEGRRYDHPLAHDAPGLGSIGGAAGVVHASPEVTDTGTGAVTLVPSHGAGDATVGRTLGVAGWPILDTDLTLSSSFIHKYQGLSIDAADAFILRDLADAGYLFAQLTVRRGVPHCGACGEPLVWETGRAWCLEAGRLPPERLELLARLLPQEPVPAMTETIPWPASERELTDDPAAPELLDCPACGHLAPFSAGTACACGGTRQPTRRRLLPVVEETLVAWDRTTPFPAGEAVRLYVADRRKLPTVIHHLVALEAADAHPGDVRLTALPTLPKEMERLDVHPDEPLDAIRCMLIGIGSTPRAGATTLGDRRVAEARRLRKVWTVARDLLAAMMRDGFAVESGPLGARLASLLDEDRAFLSRFERLRIDVLGEYDRGRFSIVHARLSRFFDDELRDGYLPLIRRRLDASGLPADKAAAYTVLAHVLPSWAELVAPLAPFTAEAIHRAFRGDGESVFERGPVPIVEVALDPRAERAYARWRSVSRALDRARRHLGLPPQSPLENVVLFVRDEEAAAELRAETETLARIANVASIDVTSPRLPWEGKRLEAVPVLPAIQKVFGTGTPRVVRLLSGLPGRRVQEGVRSRSLQVAVEGQPVEILPTMVEFIESLPDGVVPVPWELGEMFLGRPVGVTPRSDVDRPALTPDGFRLVRLVGRRLRRSGATDRVPEIIVKASGRLAEEVERLHPSLARHFGVPRVRLAAPGETFPELETLVGRTHSGERWKVWVPGVARPPPRRKPRPARARPMRPSRPDADGASVDVLAGPTLERENELGEWIRRLDIAIGRPVVGPAKLRYAWEMGLRTYDELVHAPFDDLAAIPGFGPYVAGAIVRAHGGTVPPFHGQQPRPPRRPIRWRTPTAPEGPDPSRDALRAAAEVATAPVPALTAREPPADLARPGSAPVIAAEEHHRPADRRSDEPPVPPSPLPPVASAATAGTASDADSSPSAPDAALLAGQATEDPPAPSEDGSIVGERIGRSEDLPIKTESGGDAPGPEPDLSVPAVAELWVAGEIGPREHGDGSSPTAADPLEVSPSAAAADDGDAPVSTPTEVVGAAATEGSTAELSPVTPFPRAEKAAIPTDDPPALVPTVDVTAGPVEYVGPSAPDRETPLPTTVEPPRAGLQVISDPGNGPAWAAFLDATAAGHRGLCVSREFPDRLRALLGPRDVRVLWLSKAGRPDTASPTDLQGLFARAEEAIGVGGVSAVYVDSVEVLLRVHGIERVVEFLHALDELARSRGIRAWLPVNPLLANETDAGRLRDEFPASEVAGKDRSGEELSSP